MIDLCLKFQVEQQANEVLVETGIATLDEETGSLISNSGFAVDVIGKMFKQSSETETFTDSDGNDYTVPKLEELEGWHVNVRCIDIVPAGVQEYKVEPKTPMRVWA